jgi:ATP-dependent DNA helicase PIF1
MFLRNLSTRACIRNNTRLIVKEMKNNVIDAHILKEKRLEQIVFFPRVDLIPSEDLYPVTIRCSQFPKSVFANTINKSQGQRVERVEVDSREEAFINHYQYLVTSNIRCISLE